MDVSACICSLLRELGKIRLSWISNVIGRRAYDVVNVLEGADVVSRATDWISLKGREDEDMLLDMEVLKAESDHRETVGLDDKGKAPIMVEGVAPPPNDQEQENIIGEINEDRMPEPWDEIDSWLNI